MLARHVGAAQTDDFERYLVAWAAHNRDGKDQVWSVMQAAWRMGRKITEAEAIAIVDEAAEMPRRWGADRLAKYLGLKYDLRQALGITTIGAKNVGKRTRKELHKRRARLAKERKRRASGVQARADYEAHSLSATEPWKELGMSRATWYRKNKGRSRSETSVSTPSLLNAADRPVSPARKERPSEGRFAPKKERGLPSSQTATTMAVDRYETLPLELRIAALCLPMPENLARAA